MHAWIYGTQDASHKACIHRSNRLLLHGQEESPISYIQHKKVWSHRWVCFLFFLKLLNYYCIFIPTPTDAFDFLIFSKTSCIVRRAENAMRIQLCCNILVSLRFKHPHGGIIPDAFEHGIPGDRQISSFRENSPQRQTFSAPGTLTFDFPSVKCSYSRFCVIHQALHYEKWLIENTFGLGFLHGVRSYMAFR